MYYYKGMDNKRHGKKDIMLTARIPKELLAKLNAASAGRGRSIIIRLAIQQYLDKTKS